MNRSQKVTKKYNNVMTGPSRKRRLQSAPQDSREPTRRDGQTAAFMPRARDTPEGLELNGEPIVSPPASEMW